jgi:CheY-like chemotaxis protein/anti-sigma regulatory factor (Ser/Thr protein kinase)
VDLVESSTRHRDVETRGRQEAHRRHWQAPGHDCRLLGDAARLQQVVWNLLSNAIKFTPDGGSVELALTVEASRLVIQVRDTGSGIPAEFLPHAFERFRQADSSAARHHGGLGLGLAIVRHLVEMHGGSVHAKNRTDEGGAVFTVTLPRPVSPQLVEAGNGAKPGANPADGAMRLEGIRVLLVEDEKHARESVTTFLQMLGAEVLAVDSAADAMSALDRGIPDVLLSDIGMPDEDGYSLIRRIRLWESQHGGRIPAAALTAYVRADDRAAALTAGFDTHLAKPVEPAELANVVRRLVQRGH